MQQKRLTRKEKRKLRQAGLDESAGYDSLFRHTFQIKSIVPLTDNQRLVFDYFSDDSNILLHGVAGTGKSFLSLYLSLKQVMEGKSPYEKVVLVRSVVPTRDMGFLPGNNKEKSRVYEAPYTAICTELFGRGDAYASLSTKGYLEFISTSFVRGTTFNDCIIIADEIQNMDLGELDSVITRIGKNCKVLMCGDFRQSDFRRENERSGITKFMKIIREMKSFEFVDFDQNDIVRSALVKDYIITKDRLGIHV
jgi:phosphate starvation-inducible protein PhoH and related proteins